MACGSKYKLRPGACPHTGIRYYCRLGNAILQDLSPACCISFDRHSRALCKYNAPAAVDSCACVHTNQNIPFVCVANKYCCKKQKRGRTGLTTSLSNCRIIQNSTSTSTRDRDGRTLLAIKNLRHVPQWKGCVAFLLL